jgi:GNAT superfamily N-acetyltransferase
VSAPAIRLLTESDLPSLMVIKKAAGWNQTEDDWLRLLRLQPDGCFGVELEGVVVSTTTVLRYGCDLAWIGMVLTDPSCRGRGYARALVERAMDFAQGCAVGLDASDMGKPLYSSLGFIDHSPVERWVREASSCDEATQGRLNLPPAQPQRDEDVFGADRSALLLELSRLGSASTSPRSYCYQREGSEARYFGPCVSETSEEFRTLLAWHVEQLKGRRSYLDLFPDHEGSAPIARELGFKAERRLTRMMLGKRFSGHPDKRIYSIAGFEFG